MQRIFALAFFKPLRGIFLERDIRRVGRRGRATYGRPYLLLEFVRIAFRLLCRKVPVRPPSGRFENGFVAAFVLEFDLYRIGAFAVFQLPFSPDLRQFLFARPFPCKKFPLYIR